MAFSPLATVADLTGFAVDFTGRETLAENLLASVSEGVRDAAGVPITRTTSTVVLAGTREQYLPLPGAPVRAVTAVTLDGVPVTDFKLREGRLWRPAGWSGMWADVSVTYDHGFDEVPADVVRLVCVFVAAGLNTAAELGTHRGLQYESVDDFRRGFLAGGDEVVDPTELPQRVRDSLRARFSGGAHVTGGY